MLECWPTFDRFKFRSNYEELSEPINNYLNSYLNRDNSIWPSEVIQNMCDRDRYKGNPKFQLRMQKIVRSVIESGRQQKPRRNCTLTLEI